MTPFLRITPEAAKRMWQAWVLDDIQKRFKAELIEWDKKVNKPKLYT